MINCYKITNNVWAFVNAYPYGKRYKGEVTINVHGDDDLDDKDRFNIEMLEEGAVADTPEELINIFKEYFEEN